MIDNTTVMMMVGRIIGILTKKAACHSLHPSILAASYNWMGIEVRLAK